MKNSLVAKFTASEKEKMAKIIEVKHQYDAGKLALSEAQDQIASISPSLKAAEIAYIEQELKEFEEDECVKEDIQEMLAIFAKVRVTEELELESWHPISEYKKENDYIVALLNTIQADHSLDFWQDLYSKLLKYKLHWSRKQNQLYPILEKKGFDRPSTTMWVLDDYIRDEINENYELLQAGKMKEFEANQEQVKYDILDLISKENEILFPTSLELISKEEFKEMTLGDREIGFANIQEDDLKQMNKEKAEKENNKDGRLEAELLAVLEKHGISQAKQDAIFDVAMGKLSLEQINLIYQHMPVDLSYVDEHNKVAFYTDTKHRIFPRSSNVIGREVKFCHPPKSVHLVEEIIEKFKNKEEDEVEFWINKPDLFIYIKYVAVRDSQGKFRGVLEMMQDATHLRSLEESRTLLVWDSEKKAEKEKDKEEEKKEENKEIKKEENKENNRIEEGQSGEINSSSKMGPLIKRYTGLKEALIKYNSSFKMLDSPLARILLAKATVKMASERSKVKEEDLIKFLEDYIKNYQ